MPASMTGFGRASLESPRHRIGVEIRSVNHRFLKLAVKASREVESLSPAIEEAARRRVVRGAVDVVVRLERKRGGTTYALDSEALAESVSALAAAGKRLKLEGRPDLALAASLPGVFRPVDSEDLDPKESARVLATVERALDAFTRSRNAEGKKLAAELRRRSKSIGGLVSRIAARAPRVIEEHHRKLVERVGRLLGDAASVRPEDLAREVAVLADRTDPTEEIARLGAHLERFETLLGKTSGDVGRELDFLVQEMFRETNTTGSKSNDVAVSHAVVAIKVEIEKLREQVQNIE